MMCDLDKVFLVLDFNRVCRFCLRSGGALTDLFLQEEGMEGEGDSPPIPAQVTALMDIQVDSEDSFPSKLCHRCRFKIEICYEFKEMVLRTQKVLTDNSVKEILYSQGSIIKHNEPKVLETLEDAEEQLNIKNEQIVYDNHDELQLNETQIDDESVNVNICNSLDDEADLEYVTKDDFNMFLIKKTTESNIEDEQIIDQSFSTETNDRFVKVKVKNKKEKKSDKLDEYPSIFTARRRHQCLLCLEKCGNRDVLRDHIQNHTVGTGLEPYYLFGERDLNCNLCDRDFNYRFSFIIHQRDHLNLKPFICRHPDCKMAYSSVYRLRNHLLVHADKTFPCSYCNIKFQRKSDLRSHEIIHIDEGHKFQCSICKLVCKNRRTLGAHVRKHYMEPKFHCSSCPKAYIHRSELERHMNIHSAEKRFRCSKCASAYYSRNALVRHEKTHAKTNSCVKKMCPLRVCAAREDCIFDTWQGYKDHMDSHAPADYPYNCLNCNRGFVTRSSLTKHLISCCPTIMSELTAGGGSGGQHDDDNDAVAIEKDPAFVELVQLHVDVEDTHMDDVFVHTTGEDL